MTLLQIKNHTHFVMTSSNQINSDGGLTLRRGVGGSRGGGAGSYLFTPCRDILWRWGRERNVGSCFQTCCMLFLRQWFKPSHTHLFHQGLVLVRLAEVAADVLCRDGGLLAFVHPALVLFLLRESVPEDLKSLPYGLLAHWANRDGDTTQFTIVAPLAFCFQFGKIYNERVQKGNSCCFVNV